MNNSITKLLITKRPQLIKWIVEKTDATYVTFHTHAKVVGIMRQNAKSFRFFTLAFCVHQLLQFTPNVRKLVQNLALVWIVTYI